MFSKFKELGKFERYGVVVIATFITMSTILASIEVMANGFY